MNASVTRDFSQPPSNRSEDKKTTHFVSNLYGVLMTGEHSEIVHWSEDESYFIISKPEQFAEQVLPLFCKHKQLPSFVRQLNMYGFKSKVCSKGTMAYAHPYFQKGRRELLARVERNKNFRKYSKQQEGPNSELPGTSKRDVIEDLVSENEKLKDDQKAVWKKLLSVQMQLESVLLKNNELQFKIEKMEKLLSKPSNHFEMTTQSGSMEPSYPYFKKVKQDFYQPLSLHEDTTRTTISRISSDQSTDYRIQPIVPQDYEFSYKAQAIEMKTFGYTFFEPEFLE